MLLGFYDRNGSALAVEISPEMAKAIAKKAVDIFATVKSFDCFSSSLEIRLAEFALKDILQAQDGAYPAKEPCDEFFQPPSTFKFASVAWSAGESTGAWIDVQESGATDGEPSVFWEFYDSNYQRQCTPSLSMAQLNAIADNQPLPQD